MIVKTLYRYTRENGGITVSPEKPQGEHTELVRIIADEGKILIKEGYEPTTCIDTSTANGWIEAEAPIIDTAGAYLGW